MKPLYFATALLAIMSFAGGSGSKSEAFSEMDEEPDTYAKVEIKGILDVSDTQPVQKEWEKVEKMRGFTGVRIVAPGTFDAILGPMGDPKDNFGGFKGPGFKDKDATFWGTWGVGWALFLGDKKEFHERVAKLKGKRVVVKGTVVVLPKRWPGGSGPGIRPAIVVKVSSLEAAKVKE
jgi:hypothetical protein